MAANRFDNQLPLVAKADLEYWISFYIATHFCRHDILEAPDVVTPFPVQVVAEWEMPRLCKFCRGEAGGVALRHLSDAFQHDLRFNGRVGGVTEWQAGCLAPCRRSDLVPAALSGDAFGLVVVAALQGGQGGEHDGEGVGHGC